MCLFVSLDISFHGNQAVNGEHRTAGIARAQLAKEVIMQHVLDAKWTLNLGFRGAELFRGCTWLPYPVRFHPILSP